MGPKSDLAPGCVDMGWSVGWSVGWGVGWSVGIRGCTQYGGSRTFFFLLLLRIRSVFGLPDVNYNAPGISYLLVLFMHFSFFEDFVLDKKIFFYKNTSTIPRSNGKHCG